jgi:DNA-binding response OmpR family regulator
MRIEDMNTIFNLLIVDDDDEFLEILKRRFSRRGFVVTACNNCCDALEIAARQRFDAAVVDRSLHGTTGAELVRQLKASDPGLPIIVLSGWSGAEYDTEARRAGASDYLSKPCSLGDLEAAIQRVLRDHATELPTADAV